MSYDDDDDHYDTDESEMKAEAFYNKRYASDLSYAPDCRDPDHPGCEKCMEPDDEEED